MGHARYAQTLRRAALLLGGVKPLASRLSAPVEQVGKWIAGVDEAPLKAFLQSLDIVSEGPYARSKRPVRVAAIREKQDKRQH
jgi:hypothetical protein